MASLGQKPRANRTLANGMENSLREPLGAHRTLRCKFCASFAQDWCKCAHTNSAPSVCMSIRHKLAQVSAHFRNFGKTWAREFANIRMYLVQVMVRSESRWLGEGPRPGSRVRVPCPCRACRACEAVCESPLVIWPCAGPLSCYFSSLAPAPSPVSRGTARGPAWGPARGPRSAILGLVGPRPGLRFPPNSASSEGCSFWYARTMCENGEVLRIPRRTSPPFPDGPLATLPAPLLIRISCKFLAQGQ
jgi:hypothetical protein